ncbi:DUF6907 domain-containing protein [Streptomyces niveus]|uniref:DUF6907 domain-containing protein n=1 Tax=Streptomyces niveus TaxID=193462 RepID=UPI0036D34BFB
MDALTPEDTHELIRGPIACSPWCTELHTDPLDITVEDGLIHVSADCAIAPSQGQPRVLFNLVSYENPQEGLRGPVLELTFDLGEGFCPPEYEATHRGDVDDFADQLERAAAVLRQWRTAIPAR